MLREALFTQASTKSQFLEPTAQWHDVAGNEPAREHGINHLFFYDEEAKEFWDAEKDNDLIEKLDALGDMIFVAWGISHHLGLEEPMAASQMSILYVLDKLQLNRPFETSLAVFEEVVRSNFSKFCKTEVEAQATVAHYAQRLGVKVSYRKVADFFVIRSDEDQTGSDGKAYRKNKILKSIYFSEPDFNQIIAAD